LCAKDPGFIRVFKGNVLPQRTKFIFLRGGSINGYEVIKTPILNKIDKIIAALRKIFKIFVRISSFSVYKVF